MSPGSNKPCSSGQVEKGSKLRSWRVGGGHYCGNYIYFFFFIIFFKLPNGGGVALV